LISPDTLAHEQQRSWVVVDCRQNLKDVEWGQQTYLESHIPGAVYASLPKDLSGIPTGTNGRHPLPSSDAIRVTFGRLGIDTGTQVVAYDQGSGMFAARLWWMARFMGHAAVAVLDGGWARWQREARPVEVGEISRAPVNFTGKPRVGLTRDVVEVAASLKNPSILLVDARSPDRFSGQHETIDLFGGHIPGAVNHHYLSNLADDGTFLPVDRLQARFASILTGRQPNEVICYCGSGVTACHNLLAMAHAGLEGASLFVGSWSEWSSDPTRQRATGLSC
jgi:thiosulfate/3-mercaptopyruvate sulfurtransferase